MTIPHCESCTCYKPKIRVTEITQTCTACPSQWDGHTEDGYTIYVRFRHGYLSVRRSRKESRDVGEAVMGDEVFAYNHPDADGFIDFEELKQITKGVIVWPGDAYYDNDGIAQVNQEDSDRVGGE
jgi:hypothetical protein